MNETLLAWYFMITTLKIISNFICMAVVVINVAACPLNTLLCGRAFIKRSRYSVVFPDIIPPIPTVSSLLVGEIPRGAAAAVFCPDSRRRQSESCCLITPSGTARGGFQLWAIGPESVTPLASANLLKLSARAAACLSWVRIFNRC